MNQHTKEPWQVAETCFDNDGMPESVIQGLDGRAFIAVALDFGPNNPAMREANARRIVACVNACVGIPTESLEREADLELGTFNMRRIAEQQRDELLAALELFMDLDPNFRAADDDTVSVLAEDKSCSSHKMADALRAARRAIAKAKGNAV